MPPEGGGPGDPGEWLRRARSNLARASHGQAAPDMLLEDACFDAQQAVEKSLKALLVLRGVQVPPTAGQRDQPRPHVGRKRRGRHVEA